MLAPRHCNGCGKQWNGDTPTSRARPMLEFSMGGFHSSAECANRFSQSPDCKVL